MIKLDLERLESLLNWGKRFLPKNLGVKLNFDALQRELVHAVKSNAIKIGDKTYAPHQYEAYLSNNDADTLKRKGMFSLFQQKLQEMLRLHIQSKGFVTHGDLALRLDCDPLLEEGYIRVEVSFETHNHRVIKTTVRPPLDKTLATLELLNGKQTENVFLLTRAKSVVGRTMDDNHPEIGITDPQMWVGRRHAEIEQRAGAFYLRDLNSANGTKLKQADGTFQKVASEPVLLANGAEILLADEYRLVFRTKDRFETQARVIQ